MKDDGVHVIHLGFGQVHVQSYFPTSIIAAAASVSAAWMGWPTPHKRTPSTHRCVIAGLQVVTGAPGQQLVQGLDSTSPHHVLHCLAKQQLLSEVNLRT